MPTLEALRDRGHRVAVLTGGSALLPSIAEVGEQVLDLPVRLGRPRPIGGLYELVKAPSYSTVVGLVLLAAHRHRSAPS